MNKADHIISNFLKTVIPVKTSNVGENNSLSFGDDFQDPTILGFRVIVYPYPLDGSNAFEFDTSFADYDFMQHSLLMQENRSSSSINYLRSIREYGRADLLSNFIQHFYNILKYAPWYIKDITGLNDVFKTDTKNNMRAYEKQLVFNCNESIDLKITALLDMYRNIAWDSKYQRWMLPDIMRYFKMDIYVTELRYFHKPVKQENQYNTNEDITTIGVREERVGTVEYDSQKYGLEYAEEYISVQKYSFTECEFDLNSFELNYLTQTFNTNDAPIAEAKFAIKYGNVEYVADYKILDMFIDDWALSLGTSDQSLDIMERVLGEKMNKSERLVATYQPNDPANYDQQNWDKDNKNSMIEAGRALKRTLERETLDIENNQIDTFRNTLYNRLGGTDAVIGVINQLRNALGINLPSVYDINILSKPGQLPNTDLNNIVFGTDVTDSIQFGTLELTGSNLATIEENVELTGGTESLIAGDIQLEGESSFEISNSIPLDGGSEIQIGDNIELNGGNILEVSDDIDLIGNSNYAISNNLTFEESGEFGIGNNSIELTGATEGTNNTSVIGSLSYDSNTQEQSLENIGFNEGQILEITEKLDLIGENEAQIKDSITFTNPADSKINGKIKFNKPELAKISKNIQFESFDTQQIKLGTIGTSIDKETNITEDIKLTGENNFNIINSIDDNKSDKLPELIGKVSFDTTLPSLDLGRTEFISKNQELNIGTDNILETPLSDNINIIGNVNLNTAEKEKNTILVTNTVSEDRQIDIERITFNKDKEFKISEDNLIGNKNEHHLSGSVDLEGKEINDISEIGKIRDVKAEETDENKSCDDE